MKIELLKCPECGAPLPFLEKTGFLDCGFCQSTLYIDVDRTPKEKPERIEIERPIIVSPPIPAIPAMPYQPWMEQPWETTHWKKRSQYTISTNRTVDLQYTIYAQITPRTMITYTAK